MERYRPLPRFLLAALVIFVAVSAGAAQDPADSAENPLDSGGLGFAIHYAQQRVVKIYGAAIGREHGFGSGVLVSPDGRIVTILSIFLESQSPRVVLADGSQHKAKVLARDEFRQLALLKIDVNGAPFFDVALASPDAAASSPAAATKLAAPAATTQRAAPPADGTWLIAAGNPFKIADGPEPVTIAAGPLVGRTTLAARRRNQPHPYTGPVLLLDMIVSTPGFGGGAVVDTDGRLVGVVGEAVISEHTNTWLNYAMPIEEVAAFVANPVTPRPMLAGASTRESAADAVDLGVKLFELGGQRKPAYVDRVRADSPAARAGLKKDDLILAVNKRKIATCEEFRSAIQNLRAGDAVELQIKRKNELLTLRVETEKSQ